MLDKLKPAFWIVLAPLAAVTSCDKRTVVGAKDLPEYSLGYYNDSGTQIRDVRSDWQIHGAPHHDEAGVLGVGGAGKTSHEQPRPIPDKASITWSTPDGKMHKGDVDVAKRVDDPVGFSGTIFFEFTSDGNVNVIALTYSQQRDRAVQGKRAVP